MKAVCFDNEYHRFCVSFRVYRTRAAMQRAWTGWTGWKKNRRARGGCTRCNKSRRIIVWLNEECLTRQTVAHECFHAALNGVVLAYGKIKKVQYLAVEEWAAETNANLQKMFWAWWSKAKSRQQGAGV